jgi:beta-lactamase superfamily II metal-dependent hydrolase
MKRIKTFDPVSIFLVFCLVALDCAAWWTILTNTWNVGTRTYPLGSGKDDSSLVVFSGGAKAIIDAGPDPKILSGLSGAMPQDDTSIDLAFISTPELGHFGGYVNILNHYRIGAFLYDGREPLADQDKAAWQALLAMLAARHIPLITIGTGDSIHYGANVIMVISPDNAFAHSASLRDAALVLHMGNTR